MIQLSEDQKKYYSKEAFEKRFSNGRGIWFFGRDVELNAIRFDFKLEDDTPEHVLKDILLENGFTEYCELLFPETKNV